MEEESDLSDISEEEGLDVAKGDKVPLLSEGSTEKGGSGLPKKRLNTDVGTKVEIEMEPTDSN